MDNTGNICITLQGSNNTRYGIVQSRIYYDANGAGRAEFTMKQLGLCIAEFTMRQPPEGLPQKEKYGPMHTKKLVNFFIKSVFTV